jgi:histone-lysine N-methyltransferase SETD3
MSLNLFIQFNFYSSYFFVLNKNIQVYDSYGKKCNSRFLLNYGFIVDNNDSNEFPISLTLTEDFPNYKEKKNFFSNENDMEKKFKIQENLLESQVIEFFSYLRFLLFDGNMEHIYKV